MLDTRYESVRLLGTGGMASVWLAHDGLLGRDVALKRLLAGIAGQPGMAERFAREGEAAAALSHPHIVAVYDAGIDDEGAFLVMEYVEGTTLAERLHTQGRLPSQEVANIGAAVAEALGHAHDRGVVHRDVKPANILLDGQGGLKLTDFGIAQLSWDTSDLTMTAAQLGTAAYFSPEQATGDPVGPSSDVYSLGVMLYRMATGEVPFVGENPISVAAQHVHDLPAPPSHVAPLDDRLEALILSCLAKAPRDRPTAHELAAALSTISRTDPTLPLALPVPASAAEVAGAADPTMVLEPGMTDMVDSRTQMWMVRTAALILIITVSGLILGLLTRQGQPAAQEVAPPPPIAETTTTEATTTTTGPTTTVASTTTTPPTTTAPPTTTTTAAGPETIPDALALLVDQVNSVISDKDAHPKVRKELAKRAQDLIDDWADSRDPAELEKDANRLVDEIAEARERDRIDDVAASELETTLTALLDMAAHAHDG